MKNYHNLLCLFLFLFFQNSNLSAQFGMEHGAIITIQGDTLFGKIKSENPRQLSSSITFENQEGIKTTYLPYEIQSFFFEDGETFESFHVKFSTKKKDYDEPRFIRLLEEGKINLYILDDRKSAPLFIKNSNSGITLLCISETENFDYLNVLKNEMADCENLTNLTIKKLRKKNVQHLIKRYNDCFIGIKKDYTSFDNPTRIWAWGNVAFPFKYISQGYDGNAFGGFIGVDLPFYKNHLSLEAGFLYYKGLKKDGQIQDISDNTFRVNYNFYPRQFLSPYLAAGISAHRGGSLKPHIGGGFSVNMGRHFVKAEVSYPRFPTVRVGYGFIFKK